jgi:hypothetical protein
MWQESCKLIRISVQHLVLDYLACSSTCADEDKGLAPERFHQCHLFVQGQVSLVELDVLRKRLIEILIR